MSLLEFKLALPRLKIDSVSHHPRDDGLEQKHTLAIWLHITLKNYGTKNLPLQSLHHVIYSYNYC